MLRVVGLGLNCMHHEPNKSRRSTKTKRWYWEPQGREMLWDRTVKIFLVSRNLPAIRGGLPDFYCSEEDAKFALKPTRYICEICT